MSKTIRIAIDGPGGAGKSTIAKEIAKKLVIEYVDTGAMYRAVGYKMKIRNVESDDLEKVNEVLKNTKIDFENGIIYLDGKNVEDKIRTAEISKAASDFSSLAPVREKLVEIQREIGEKKSVVMDGRDIGTNVFPNAEFKFFLTADDEERARRRYKEMIEKGEKASFEQVLEDIRRRDYADSNRELNPLKMAEDAILVDSTNMCPQEVVNFIINRIEE